MLLLMLRLGVDTADAASPNDHLWNLKLRRGQGFLEEVWPWGNFRLVCVCSVLRCCRRNVWFYCI